MDKRIKNIEQQENTLDKAEILIEQLENLIYKWENLHPDFTKLMDYYGSTEWIKDMEESNQGVFEDIKCGVLSEDAVYNLYTRQRNLNFRMVRIAIDYLEK